MTRHLLCQVTAGPKSEYPHVYTFGPAHVLPFLIRICTASTFIPYMNEDLCAMMLGVNGGDYKLYEGVDVGVTVLFVLCCQYGRLGLALVYFNE